jgi:lipase chaperone LimK
MESRSNRHIQKFNQLVEVYDPDGVEQVDLVSTREERAVRERRAAIRDLQAQVESLTSEAFFSESERAEMSESEQLPDPDDAADSQRTEMRERLEQTETALTEALSTDSLDAADDLSR